MASEAAVGPQAQGASRHVRRARAPEARSWTAVSDFVVVAFESDTRRAVLQYRILLDRKSSWAKDILPGRREVPHPVRTAGRRVGTVSPTAKLLDPRGDLTRADS